MPAPKCPHCGRFMTNMGIPECRTNKWMCLNEDHVHCREQMWHVMRYQF